MPGARIKFSATAGEMLGLLRAAREFEHLRGLMLHAMTTAANPKAWRESSLRAYEAALPTLLLRERRNITTEEAVSRAGLFFPNAIYRRIAFLFGSRCVACDDLGYGYRMLPVSRNIPDPAAFEKWRPWRLGFGRYPGDMELPELTFDMLRQPFVTTLGDTVEPLCPYCRLSFAAWVCRHCGPLPRSDEIEISATAWLAGRVAREATVEISRTRKNSRRERPRDSADRTPVAMAGSDAALPSVRF